MNLVKIVTKNMRQRALATWLTGTSVALGVALAVAILLIKQGVQQRFEQGTLGYEMVVGARAARCNWCSTQCTTSTFRRGTFPGNCSNNCVTTNG